MQVSRMKGTQGQLRGKRGEREERQIERVARVGTGLGYSADSRATVHTPKRVFVRFHFTPNYLVHTRREETGEKR